MSGFVFKDGQKVMVLLFYKGMQVTMSKLTFNSQHDCTTNAFDSTSHLNCVHSSLSFLV